MECECCSLTVSPHAEVCPSCGHPVHASHKRFVAWLLFAPVTILGLAALSRMVSPPPKPFEARIETREEMIRRISDETGVPMRDVRYAVDQMPK